MIEVVIPAAVVGLGYMLRNNKRNQENSPDERISKKLPKKIKPNGLNIFNSNRVNQIRISEQKISDKQYEQVFDPKNVGSNLINPGPPEPYFNKVDYTEKDLPLQFQDNPPRLDGNGILSYKTNNTFDGVAHPTGNPVSDGWYGISLTGEPINPKNFTHNNMQPFFGSHVRQNIDQYTNRSIIENFTGQQNFYKKKKEIPQLFDPEANITNVYGMSNLSGYQRERYIVSNKRSNEAPTEKIYVGPGLNKGYTWCPSGGFQQAETRDYILPKTVDELRVKTNPKLTYHLPVVPGSKPSRPPKIGVVQKNRPDSFAVWTPDRYFVTMGDRSKPKQRAEIVLKHSNRTTTDIRRAIGPAGPREGFSQEGIRANVKVSERCQYTPGGPRGINAIGKWTIPEECPQVQGNYVPMKKCDSNGYPEINKLTGKKAPDNFKKDKRTGPGSMHDYGKSGIHLHKNVREDTACLPSGNIVGLDQQGYVPITSDLRDTRKQNIIGNPRWASNMQSTGKGNVIWDPNDIPKTTIKETTISDGRLGGAHNQEHLMPRVHDPDDVPKVTNKETTMTDYSGNVYLPTQDRREANHYYAQTTNREITSDIQYFGNSVGDEKGAYNIIKVDPKTTKRQFTSKHSYTGGAKNDVVKPRERSYLKNVTTSSYREKLSKGRTPAREGPKNSLDPRMVNATTNKFGDLQNTIFNQREKMSTKVYNSLPQANTCGKTKNKKIINNKEIRGRLDPNNLAPFRKNPYTQSLSSYWTY